MNTRTAYCPSCKSEVRLVVLDPPLHGDGGQATLPDADDTICLDLGARCGDRACPLSNMPRVVMGLRLARSGLPAAGRLDVVEARCDGCGAAVPMRMIDADHGVCPDCGSVNELLVLDVETEGRVALTVVRGTPAP